MVVSAHKAAVTAMDFRSQVLLTASEDGSLALFAYQTPPGRPEGSFSFAMRRPCPRPKELQRLAGFDLLRHDLLTHRIAALALPDEPQDPANPTAG